MEPKLLPNGNLLIPKRADADGVIGDGMIEVSPESIEFQLWLPLLRPLSLATGLCAMEAGARKFAERRCPKSQERPAGLAAPVKPSDGVNRLGGGEFDLQR